MSHVVRTSNASLGQLWQNQSHARQARGEATIVVQTHREPPPVRYTPRPAPLSVAPIVVAPQAEPLVIEHAAPPAEIEPGYAEVVARHHGETTAAEPARVVDRPTAPSRVDHQPSQLRPELQWSARHADARREVVEEERRIDRAPVVESGHLVRRTTVKTTEAPQRPHLESVEHVARVEPHSILRVRPKDESEDRETHRAFVAAPAEAGREKGGLESEGDHATPAAHELDLEA